MDVTHHRRRQKRPLDQIQAHWLRAVSRQERKNPGHQAVSEENERQPFPRLAPNRAKPRGGTWQTNQEACVCQSDLDRESEQRSFPEVRKTTGLARGDRRSLRNSPKKSPIKPAARHRAVIAQIHQLRLLGMRNSLCESGIFMAFLLYHVACQERSLYIRCLRLVSCVIRGAGRVVARFRDFTKSREGSRENSP